MSLAALLTNLCQLEKLLLDEWVFGFFSKAPILCRLVPQIVRPIHATSRPRLLYSRAYDSLNCFDIESKTRPRHRRPKRNERLVIRLPSLLLCRAIGRFLMFARHFPGRSFLSWALLPIGPLNSLNVALRCEIEFAWNSGKFLEWPPLSANVL